MRVRERNPENRIRAELGLFAVPSRSIIVLSSPTWSSASCPINSLAMVVLTFATPSGRPYAKPRLVAVAQFQASCSPVLAPLGRRHGQPRHQKVARPLQWLGSRVNPVSHG